LPFRLSQLIPNTKVRFPHQTPDADRLLVSNANSPAPETLSPLPQQLLGGRTNQRRNPHEEKGGTMNAMNRVLWISLLVVALFAGLGVTRPQTGAKVDVVTAISNLENDAVKADLAGDPAFYQKVLAEDWTRGDSDGTYYTKAELLNLMADTKDIKTNSEKLSELKVRVYGNTAVATYKDTYDLLIKGEHRAHTIIATDTFVKMGSDWKQVASHGSEAKAA
jgi:hypothetical protein